MRYKGISLSRTKVVNNILRLYSQVENTNFDWYANERNEVIDFIFSNINNTFVKGIANTLIPKYLGVVAAFSPLKSWEENKKIAELYLLTGRLKHTKAQGAKATAILNSGGRDAEILDILRGQKICSFYMNLRHVQDDQYVTIDRHACCIAMGVRFPQSEQLTMTSGQYAFFTECYILAAQKIGIRPSLLQSLTWEYFRTNKTILPRLRANYKKFKKHVS